jgi:hypothetical protein
MKVLNIFYKKKKKHYWICQKTKTLKCKGRAKTDKDVDDENVNVVVSKKHSCVSSPVTTEETHHIRSNILKEAKN